MEQTLARTFGFFRSGFLALPFNPPQHPHHVFIPNIRIHEHHQR